MLLSERVKLAPRVFVIGNGGSYANAMHIVNDLLSCGIAAFSMDPATLTAFANDHGYESAFDLWIKTVGESRDLLIALSGSGKSQNILRAVETAKRMGMDVHCEFGYPKGLDMQQAEEEQIMIGHELMRELRK